MFLTQADYLAQVLEPYIGLILEAFALITHTLRPSVESLFIEDKTQLMVTNQRLTAALDIVRKHGIILMLHLSTSLDINPIKKC